MQQKYPHDSFEPSMKYSLVDGQTSAPIRPGQDAGGKPENIKHQFLPRIKCNDCPGRIYAAGPEHTAGNFEVHLRNRVHKERVEARRRQQ
jgi:SWI/SNF-related matrix-associated actin-dependent regulator of chromatin subfamily B protein 1